MRARSLSCQMRLIRWLISYFLSLSLSLREQRIRVIARDEFFVKCPCPFVLQKKIRKKYCLGLQNSSVVVKGIFLSLSSPFCRISIVYCAAADEAAFEAATL